MNGTIRVIFGGDVMLGRIVADVIRANGPEYPLGAIAPLLAGADLSIVNLECAITDSEERWGGAPKAFYFGAPPAAVQSLVRAGIDVVSLANNHTLDFDITGLNDTLRHLDAHGIRHAGAGPDLAAARRPAFFSAKGVRFGMVAYCDHQEDFAAGESRPGVAYLDLDDERTALRVFAEDIASLRAAGVDWPVLSLHWGPNMVERPSASFRRLAHAAIDLGFRILFGHSAHVFHGIEVYHGCPILYAAGDLVDDYYVDPDLRNDHALLFELELSRDEVRAITLHPVLIEDCRAVPAPGPASDYITRRALRLNAELGTRIVPEDGRLHVALSDAPRRASPAGSGRGGFPS